MIRHTRTAAALAALGLAAGLTVAAAPDGCYVALDHDATTEADDVIACEEQHWFHRSTSHAGNLGYVDPSGTHGLATFDTNPPAGSVSGGNGGGYLATQALGQDPDLLEAQFSGTFTGVLDRMDIDLHQLVATEDELQGEVTIQVIVEVAGAEIVNFDEVVVPTVVEEASAAGSTRADFAITDLAARFEQFGGALPNAPDTTHEVTLKIRENWSDNVAVWAFDTTEVPGGITFNAVELEPGTVVLDAA